MEQEAEGGNSSTFERVLPSLPPTTTCPDAGIYYWHSDYYKPNNEDGYFVYL